MTLIRLEWVFRQPGDREFKSPLAHLYKKRGNKMKDKKISTKVLEDIADVIIEVDKKILDKLSKH